MKTFETSDTNLAAYIILKGVDIKRLNMQNNNKVSFIFESDNINTIKSIINEYYKDNDYILSYNNILRNLKSRIANTLIEKE